MVFSHPSEKYEFVHWDDNRNPIFMGKCQIDGNQSPQSPPTRYGIEEGCHTNRPAQKLGLTWDLVARLLLFHPRSVPGKVAMIHPLQQLTVFNTELLEAVWFYLLRVGTTYVLQSYEWMFEEFCNDVQLVFRFQVTFKWFIIRKKGKHNCNGCEMDLVWGQLVFGFNLSNLYISQECACQFVSSACFHSQKKM